MWIAVVVLSVLCAVLLYMVIRLSQFRFADRDCHEKQFLHVLTERNQRRKAMGDVYRILEIFAGGIHKRIDETREVAEVIQLYSPELFKRIPGLVHWLSATDEFLCNLRDTAMPEGCSDSDDARRKTFANNGRTDAIYREVLATAHGTAT